MPTTPPKDPRAPRVPTLKPNEERPETCYCSALPRGSGPCLPCYVRRLRMAEGVRPGTRSTRNKQMIVEGKPDLVVAFPAVREKLRGRPDGVRSSSRACAVD